MTEKKIPFVILSAEKSDNNGQTNKQKTTELNDLLKFNNFNFKQVKGFYCGSLENSFLVYLSDNAQKRANERTILAGIARDFKQESILYVDVERTATLYCLDPITQLSIGQFQHVQKHEIIDLNAWTQDLTTGEYYTCK